MAARTAVTIQIGGEIRTRWGISHQHPIDLQCLIVYRRNPERGFGCRDPANIFGPTL